MIPLSAPNLGNIEQAYLVQAVKSGWVGPSGPFVEQFEDDVAKISGRTWAIATITGTAALHVSAFVLWGFKPNIRIWRNAFPAMRNVRENLWGFGKIIGSGGINHDHALYECRSLVLADRAPAIGELKILNANIECYSFAANKIVTCGHGGAIVGDDLYLEACLREEIHQGYGMKGHFNYRMANINAAIGCAQMERIDELKSAKRRIWQKYADAGLPMIDRGESRWMATIKPNLPPELVVGYLEANGIEARAEPSGVSIPCSTNLSECDQDKVIEICKSLLPS